jgi:hypothetical protein
VEKNKMTNPSNCKIEKHSPKISNLFILVILIFLSSSCTPNLKRSVLEYSGISRLFTIKSLTGNNSSAGNNSSTATILSSSKDITSYSIPSLGISGIISGAQISLSSDTLTSFTPLVARFTTTGKSVTISGTNQISDTTANDYSSNLIYTVTAEDGSTQNYTVTLTAPRAYGGSSLVIWLKADSLGLSDGTSVSTWTDLSGYGNHFTQSTGSLQPTYKLNQVNNLPSVQFRMATAQIMRIVSGGTSLYITNSGTLFFVFKLIQTSTTTILNINGGNGREMALTNPAGQYLQCRNGVFCSATSSISIPFNTYISIGSVQDANNTVNELWNGDLKGSISAVGGNFDYVAGALPGTSYLTNGFLDADFAEVLYFNTNLTQNEVDKVFCYLRAKYKLTATNTSCGT